MEPQVQFTTWMIRHTRFARRTTEAFLLLGMLHVCPARLTAQEAPPHALGRVEGHDISVEGGNAAGASRATIAPSIFVANGNIITVHSGQARLTLASGGEVDICGPAKLTLLQSGSAITLALNFGRMRVQLPAGADLRIFTPTIIATPIDIGGGPRDVTIGLDLDDSICVLAASGAVQFEHQFTGERLIVPQMGEFFLSPGRLLPVAGVPGSCQCASMAIEPQVQPQPAPTPSPAIPEMPLARPTETTQMPIESRPPVGSENRPETNVESGTLAHGNQAHPLAPTERNEVPAAPPASIRFGAVVAPALIFSARSPAPPDPGPDVVLLAREARVDPEWTFTGRVEAPALARAIERALGEGSSTTNQAHPKPDKKKRRFWALLRRIFKGPGTQD
jgi:hypothetical protein